MSEDKVSEQTDSACLTKPKSSKKRKAASIEESGKQIECSFCSKQFLKTQGLAAHLKHVHGTSPKKTKPSSVGASEQNSKGNLQPSDDSESDVRNAVQDAVEKVLTQIAAENVVLNKKASEPSHAEKPTKRRGADHRKQHSIQLKAEVIHDFDFGIHPHAIAEKYNINRSLVSKWLKDKTKIVAAATEAHTELLKIRPSRKYSRLSVALFDKYHEARSRGFIINFDWLWCQARKIYREITGDPKATLGKHVITAFLKKHNIRMRARHRDKRPVKQSFETKLRIWHATARERLIRTGRNDRYDEKWGRYKPCERFNVDQIPLPFAVGSKKTQKSSKDEENAEVLVTPKTHSNGTLDHRQCQLQVCFRPTGEQPRLALIFRGTGKRVSQDEVSAYHPDVDVYFQEKAWADIQTCVDWVNKTLSAVVDKEERFVVFCDNQTGQISREFKEAVSKKGGMVWYGLPGATDLWQPVDAGYSQLLKTLVGQAHSAWLNDDENSEKWLGSALSAKERRILITHWAGDAYAKLLSPEYDGVRLRVWQKSGCLMTANGVDDELITPEGLNNYKVPTPSIIAPTSYFPQSEDNIVDADFEMYDNRDEVELEPEACELEQVLEDCYEDRDEKDELVGREVIALYENGWFTGKIEYYNKKLKEYKVKFRDDSTDYLAYKDFDGVEVILT
ncbi:predicted protein [Nematostella vectensis]|uniref:C2H2-type domain-containing protein n=1 Tax=Nematostella vectensis TaxID=45351 RepID=A7S4A1_NEMVE|nr:predicted protein [Nematostella vectensis]|eukprot:XP_001633544.1 predicted protein [Nematostella vectensis]